MDIIVWIGLCVLACIGAIELYGKWAYGVRMRGKIAMGCHLIPYASSDAKRKSQLEYYLAYLEWHGQKQPLVFACEEISPDASQQFRHYMGDLYNVHLCTFQGLPQLLESLEHESGTDKKSSVCRK